MLTKEESKWIREMQKLLDNCPSARLGFCTTGDSDITIYDESKGNDIACLMDSSNREFVSCIDAVGANLGQLIFPNNVHSTAG